MVSSIGPFWDSNETWLVLGIGVLLAAFPLAHGIVLQALYLPVVAMLVGLMLRGVAFELRMKAPMWVDRVIATSVVTVSDRYDNLTRRHTLTRSVDGRELDAVAECVDVDVHNSQGAEDGAPPAHDREQDRDEDGAQGHDDRPEAPQGDVGDDDHQAQRRDEDHPGVVARGHPQSRLGRGLGRPVRRQSRARREDQDVAGVVVPADRPRALGHGPRRDEGHQVAGEVGPGRHQEPDGPQRPPVEEHGVANDDNLLSPVARDHSDGYGCA